MDIVEFLVVDGNEKGYIFNKPFVAKVLEGLLKIHPMLIIQLNEMIEEKQSGDENYKLEEFLIKFYPKLKKECGNITDFLIKKGCEVTVNKKGDMVFVLEGEECRI